MRLHLHCYDLVRSTGAHHYLRCRRCGHRHLRAMYLGGHQPIDRHWLQTGEWAVLAPPPRTPSGYRPR